MGKRKKSKRWRKLFLWILFVLILFTGGLFAIGYFYYGSLIRTYLKETIYTQSKGIYRAEIGEIYLDVLNGNLHVQGLTLTPDLRRYHELAGSDTLFPLIFGLKIGRIRVNNFEIQRYLREHVIDIKSIRFTSPEVVIYRMKSSSHVRELKSRERMFDLNLPPAIAGLFIGEILLENGKLTFRDHSGDSLKIYHIPSCNIRITGVNVRPGIHSKHLYNSDDITVVIRGFEIKTKNGMNMASFGEIGLSTGKQEIYVKNFHLTPLFNRHDYCRKLGFQTDRINVEAGEIKFSRIDLRSLILYRSLIAEKLSIAKPIIDDYRDKRIPIKPGFRAIMPQEGIRSLKTVLKIDTVILNGGKATYSEQVGSEPGTIHFDKMNATLLRLTNDSIQLNSGTITDLHATAWLQGNAKLDARMRFRAGDKKNTFTFSARMGSFDLCGINPMLSKLVPGHVRCGQIKQMIIPDMRANDDVSHGTLLLYYNNLKIQMDVRKPNPWDKIKAGVINFIANDILVNDDNPTKSGKMNEGVICFTRDKQKGIFNYLWKSAFSGIKSTVGINNKEQKKKKKSRN